jgi:COP9 signalosome complex subunit 5
VGLLGRYYILEVEYYMSTLSSKVMSILTENFLWMRTLGTTPQLEAEVRGMLIGPTHAGE